MNLTGMVHLLTLHANLLSAPQVCAAAKLLQRHAAHGRTKHDHSTSASEREPVAVQQPAGLHQASDAAGSTGGQQATQPTAAGQRAVQAAADMAAVPLQPNCTVAIMMDPSPEYVVAVLACVAVGYATITPFAGVAQCQSTLPLSASAVVQKKYEWQHFGAPIWMQVQQC